jgi:hypothetical protein
VNWFTLDPKKFVELAQRILFQNPRLINQNADSDEFARAIRDDVARDYEMISPGFGASLA